MNQHQSISIRGARVHNLKNVDLELPKKKLIVVTGLSGSGKSSLAFDTIYAEGQRRYMESLSSYARHFLGNIEKPDVDSISGLSPTLAIHQRGFSSNPRSTVGTMTEIYDHLRNLFASIGKPHCPSCNVPIEKHSPLEIARTIFELAKKDNYYLLAPVIKNQKGNHHNTFIEILKNGFAQVRVNGETMKAQSAKELFLDRTKQNNIDIIFNQKITYAYEVNEILDLVRQALEMGDGYLSVLSERGEETSFSQYFVCGECDYTLSELLPRNFSFNSPQGACSKCGGLGVTSIIDPEAVIPNKKLSLAEGAIRPWARLFANQSSNTEMLEGLAKKYKFSLRTSVADLPKKSLKVVLYGDKKFEGVVKNLEEKYKTTDSDYVRKEIEKYMNTQECPVCSGKRLKEEYLAVTVGGLSISDFVKFSFVNLEKLLEELLEQKVKELSKEALTDEKLKVSKNLLKEIQKKVISLNEVGLHYLDLDRSSVTLSGGELQRIRLATQINSLLVDVVYILDEPSIGLHSRDNEKLIKTLEKLRDLGNTVIVVEHDEAMMKAADILVDVGPGAGAKGGEIVAMGTPEEVLNHDKSLTGKYLSGRIVIDPPEKYRKGNGKTLKVFGAEANNLKKVDVEIPLGKFVCMTGVSGSGKSTLTIDILAKALSQHFYRSKENPLKHKKIEGIENIDKVVHIDQSPIGRTPRSNPATYTGVFTPIRDLFVNVTESKIKGFKAGHFSFNVKGGRCEACQGEGMKKFGMQFLDEAYVPCDECNGTRYSKEALEVLYRGKNVAEVLDMTVAEARIFFKDVPSVYDKLHTLYEVGLEYLHLGQSATTLSGGEAQRIKLAAELSHKSTGNTLYILDEPTTGLHFEDVRKLLILLDKLVEKGNTVLVIEHNLDVIKSSDWVIDLGPDGGSRGGEIVAAGTPKEIAKVEKSLTGKFLKEVL